MLDHLYERKRDMGSWRREVQPSATSKMTLMARCRQSRGAGAGRGGVVQVEEKELDEHVKRVSLWLKFSRSSLSG